MATCTGDSIVQKIQRTECIGNSLQKINSNFAGLDGAVCELQIFNENTLAIAGMLKAEDQKITQAIANVDYTVGTYGINGILKSNSEGTVTAAVSSVDYYVPGSTLYAYNTTITGTLSTAGDAWFNAVYSKGDVIAFSTSDERLKRDIKQIDKPLQKLKNIKGVEYSWNTDLQSTFTGKDVGVIAQDVEKILPEAVVTRENGYKGVRYEKIIPLLIESIKALEAEVEELKAKIKT